VRHPIIERINQGVSYIPHDINIGRDITYNKPGDAIEGILLHGSNGAGKCYRPNTPVMMLSGEIKLAKNIKKYDKLMGDDSTPRTVLSITKGKGQMYKIIPTKGDSFTVNGPHILCLKSSSYKHFIWDKQNNRYRAYWMGKEHKLKSKSFTVKKQTYIKNINTKHLYNTKEQALIATKKFITNVITDKNSIIEITVDDYIKKSSQWRKNYYLYRVGVDFQEKNIDMDPYVLGHWLGDGTSANSQITTADKEIVDYYEDYCKKIGLYFKKGTKYHYRISTCSKYGGANRNCFLNILRKYNLIKNKHIPNIYKYNSRKVRLAVLAGIIDADGSNSNNTCLDIIQKNKRLMEDIIYLARSLGFACYISKCYKTCTNAAGGPKKGTYYRTAITGKRLKDIPLLLKYKIPKRCDVTKIDVMITSFKIRKLKIGNYVGFQIDKNQRFLLGDFTVTHNSAYMKAIGMSIIMAQTGMYVPAKSFEYSPYSSLLCRITGNDNLFKGLSSFALEMTELRAILKRSGPRTIVIGDEVCRGTEHISGNAIVASTILTLAKSGSSFIFATHLHKIAEMERIKKLPNVKSFHLSVKYNKEKNILVFDRQLKPGSGPKVYGLSVASHIIHDKEFLRLAQEIKNEQLNLPNTILPKKTSQYNSKIYVDSCNICHSAVNSYGYLHTHHINHQKDCISGFINKSSHIKKNQESNLVILCRKCHDMVHDKDISMKYIQTSKGRQLQTNIHLRAIKKSAKKRRSVYEIKSVVYH